MSRSEAAAALRWGKTLGREPNDESRAELAAFLRRLADAIEDDAVESRPYGIAVSVVGQKRAGAGWTGFEHSAELRLAVNNLQERVNARRWGRESRDVVETEIVQRTQAGTDRRAFEAAHPEKCELCSDRFRTPRGLAMHVARSRMKRHGGDRYGR